MFEGGPSTIINGHIVFLRNLPERIRSERILELLT